MKKEIMHLIKSKETGTFRLNNISRLCHFTQIDGMKQETDYLYLEFDNINGVYFSSREEIISRDYDGIIEECAEKTSIFLLEVSKRLCSDMRAGYRNKEH